MSGAKNSVSAASSAKCRPTRSMLVTRLPAGPRLAELPGDQLTDELVEEFLRSVLALRAAGIAHGALSPQTVVVASGGPCLRNFGRASSSASAARTDRDLAAAVAVAAVVVGVDRTVAAVRRVLDAGMVRSVLTQLQRSTLDPVTERLARSQKGFLGSLRQALAAAMGVEVPKLVEAKRTGQPDRPVGHPGRVQRRVGIPERHRGRQNGDGSRWRSCWPRCRC